MQYQRLRRNFFIGNTHVVAKELLGKLLVRTWRGHNIAGRIVEVESYVGRDDAACHAARGKTSRNEVMFGEAGHVYVYLIYGMYNCLNIVTELPKFPAAVLIRALEPVNGIEQMQRARRNSHLDNLTTGPGKLTQALRITRAINGEDLTSSTKLLVADDGYVVNRGDIAVSPRIGVDYAGQDAQLPWRYYLKGSQFISIP